MIGFDSLAENLSLTQEVILTNKFIQCPGPHPIGKGSLSFEKFCSLLLKKFCLFLQSSAFFMTLIRYALCSLRSALISRMA